MKWGSIALLACAEVSVMGLWFVSAAALPEMLAEHTISATRQALLSSAVQIGFVAGALVFAAIGLADRFDPRRVLALCSLGAAAGNAALLVTIPGSDAAITARFVTGVLLAGVYPVGMKIAVGWGTRDRGLLIGLLVGALTLGSAAPHLVSWLGGADWRVAVASASIIAAIGGLLIVFAQLGPHHASAPRLDVRALGRAWSDRRIRLAYLGYLGHMWELYAMWAWIAVAVAVSFEATMPAAQAAEWGRLTAFAAIALGGFACVLAGGLADRFGKEETTIVAMVLSGSMALATAATFGGPAWLTIALVLAWGATIVPDSAQFSALVADAAPAERAGSLMTFQTALGFTLTFFTVQATPVVAAHMGWPATLALLAIGPALGTVAMVRLRQLRDA
jgi:MFS family permease